jgi:hypothetical protein
LGFSRNPNFRERSRLQAEYRRADAAAPATNPTLAEQSL